MVGEWRGRVWRAEWMEGKVSGLGEREKGREGRIVDGGFM